MTNKKIYKIKINTKEKVSIDKNKEYVVWVDNYGNTQINIIGEGYDVFDTIDIIKHDNRFQAIKKIIAKDNVDMTYDIQDSYQEYTGTEVKIL